MFKINKTLFTSINTKKEIEKNKIEKNSKNLYRKNKFLILYKETSQGKSSSRSVLKENTSLNGIDRKQSQSTFDTISPKSKEKENKFQKKNKILNESVFFILNGRKHKKRSLNSRKIKFRTIKINKKNIIINNYILNE